MRLSQYMICALQFTYALKIFRAFSCNWRKIKHGGKVKNFFIFLFLHHHII